MAWFQGEMLVNAVGRLADETKRIADALEEQNVRLRAMSVGVDPAARQQEKEEG